MSKIKSPQEKKALSLERDRRNTHGENSKSSRKSIRRGKQRSHMKERRAAGLILGRLRDEVDENAAIEADVQAKSTIAKIERTAFKKSPDVPLGIVVKRKLAKRQELAQSDAKPAALTDLNLHVEGAFDTPYIPALHKRLILIKLRNHLSATGWNSSRKRPAYVRANIRKEAMTWKQAILCGAPLMKGFLADEPQWRDRMLRWCEETLSRS